MRMGFIVLFGIFMVVLGLGLVLRVVFHLDFPVGRFILALFLILVGVRILLGNRMDFFWHGESNKDIIFSERYIDGSSLNEKEYNVVFGSAKIDLSKVNLKDVRESLKVNAVFGGVEIKVDRNMPLRVKAEAAFGAVNIPNESVGGFGSSDFKSKNYNSDNPYLYIKASAVFGGIEIKYK